MEENKVSKIVVKKDYELVDLIHKIEGADYNKILLTFNESSDILISPINFKVLQKKADELDKLIVAQIIQNSAGVVNARNAGVEVIETPGEVPVSVWKKAYDHMIERSKQKTNSLKGDFVRNSVKKDKEDSLKDQQDIEDVTSKKETSDSIIEEVPKKADRKQDREDEVLESQDANIGDKTVKSISDKDKFSSRIDSTLKRVSDQKGKSKVVEEDDFVMAVGGDISEVSQTKINKSMSSRGANKFNHEEKRRSEQDQGFLEQNQNLEYKRSKEDQQRKERRVERDTLQKNVQKSQEQRTKKVSQKEVNSGQSVPKMFTPTDFNKMNKDFKSKHKVNTETRNLNKSKSLHSVKKVYANFGGALQKFFGGFMVLIKKLGKKKALYLFGGGFLVIFGLIAVIMYNLMSRVVIEIFIEKRPVSIEKEFTGQDGSTFSIEEKTVSVEKNEEVREREDSTEATGVGARGDKASGLLVVKCLKGDTGAKMEIPAGTVATTKEGKKFKIQSDINKACPSFTTATAEATQVGEEYNVQSGTFFTIEGFDSDEIYADNTSAFTGGYKEEYTMVAEKDIEKVVKDLKKIVFEETEEALKGWGKSEGWEIIPSSIDHEIVGDPEPDYPVGSETDLVSVKLNVRSTALYYNKEEVENNVENLLVKEAKDKKIFEGVESVDKLKDMDYDINVSVNDEEQVSLKLKASAMAKPEVDREEITAELEGKSWEEGNKYLQELGFTVKPPMVEFEPEWFPKFTWKFPAGRNKIILKVVEIESEDSESN